MQQEELTARVPPHNMEAEMCLLGSLMLDSDVVVDVLPILRSEYFYRNEHRQIYRVILELYDKQKPTHFMMVIEELKKRGLLDSVGGPEYIMELAETVPTALNAEHYATIVRDKALLRNLISVSSRIMRDAFDERGDADALIDRAERMILDVFGHRVTSEGYSIREVIRETLSRIDDYHRRDSRLTGFRTGFDDLDDLIGGLQNSQLIIVAGRPSMGKSSLALNIATNVAVKDRRPVLIFSLEMGRQQVVQNMICAYAKVSAHSLRKGMLPQEDIQRLLIAAGDLEEAPLFIDDTSILSPVDLRARARRFKTKHKLELIFVDYLQLMHVEDPEGRQSRQEEISKISRSLKALARELDIPVVAVSQLSRAVETREGRRPLMSDLRESGALEQDADVIILLYREDYYNRDAPPTNVAELNVAKQRNGPTGTIKLRFDAKWMRFDNRAREQERFE